MKRLLAAGLSLVCCLIFAEAVFSALPVSGATHTGYYIDADVLTYPAHRKWQVATGWDLRNPQTVHSNNMGFSSGVDFVFDPTAVGLIGDSYVEASMLDPATRPESQLTAALGGRRPVYAMGTPGTALLDYAERVRLAHDRWGLRDFVILMEAGDIRQSLCGSGNVVSRCLDPLTLEPRIARIAPASELKRILSDSALLEYVFAQLKIDPARMWRRTANALQQMLGRSRADGGATAASPPLSPDRPEVTEAVAREFFARVRPMVTGKLVIVVDGSRTADPAATNPSAGERARFIDIARAQGALVIDSELLYREHFAHSTLALNVGPYDLHLNPIGVHINCVAVAAALRGQ